MVWSVCPKILLGAAITFGATAGRQDRPTAKWWNLKILWNKSESLGSTNDMRIGIGPGVVALLMSYLGLAAEGADPLVRRGVDQFEFEYALTLPEIREPGRLWVPLAQSNSHQDVTLLGVTAHRAWDLTHDREFGNAILTLLVGPEDSGRSVTVGYRVRRREKGPYPRRQGESVEPFLAADRLVPSHPTLARLAETAVAEPGKDGSRGRALFDHVLGRMTYDKQGTGWGLGDAMYACDSRTGNCTDFHAYFIGLARSLGIPARFAIGFTVPADRDSGTVAGYHCWAEYLEGGRWVPIDISEADKHPEAKEYYASHHPANRFEFTVGRDLQVEPGPESGPISILVYPLLEVGGERVPVATRFEFQRLSNQPLSR